MIFRLGLRYRATLRVLIDHTTQIKGSKFSDSSNSGYYCCGMLQNALTRMEIVP